MEVRLIPDLLDDTNTDDIDDGLDNDNNDEPALSNSSVPAFSFFGFTPFNSTLCTMIINLFIDNDHISVITGRFQKEK